jgi:hypothetical protein
MTITQTTGVDYAMFRSTFGPTFHQAVLNKLRRHDMGQHTPHVDVPSAILTDKIVWDTVTQMLGKDASPDACRHVHLNNHPEDGPWHRDNYDEDEWPGGPADWAVMFYFPQDTPLEMGPTSIRVNGQEITGAGPAGTCLLVRGGDAEHRARANTTGQQRYMLKYLFRSA